MSPWTWRREVKGRRSALLAGARAPQEAGVRRVPYRAGMILRARRSSKMRVNISVVLANS
jgi:hypothetical protein